MKKFIALLLFTGSMFITVAVAQCPEISVTGPAGIIPPGGTMKFTAKVDRIENDPLLKYTWSISSGTIVSGHRTPTIEVKPKGTSLTATVEISGLPENCPNTASERGWWDPAPTGIKVGVWKNEADLAPLKQFVAEMAIEPGHQGYVFIVRGPSSTQESLNELRNTVLSFGPKDQNGDSPRITIIESEGPDELAEIWRVPPGASNPECESCHKSECPKITVKGPEGIWNPGDTVKFIARLAPSNFKSLSYLWAVKGGTLSMGQGTPDIGVLTPEGFEQTITATVEIVGLPSSCPSTGSEMAQVALEDTYLLLDEFSIAAHEIDRAALDKLAKRLNEYPAAYGFIIEYFPTGTFKSLISQKMNRIRGYMRSRGIAENGYKIVTEEASKLFTRIYSVPPGVDHPQR